VDVIVITIGDFARLGRVSVRMLRHYDAISLLRPEHVDPRTGYRFYTRDQVRRLNRIVALKELGLRLDQVRAIVDESLTAVELRAMLRLRQAELEAQIRDSEQQLARVEARLRLIETEDTMTHPGITTKTVPATAVVGLTALAASATHQDVGPVIQPLYPKVMQQLAAAGVNPVGPSIAYYTPAPEESEDALCVHVTFPVAAESVPGLDRIDIPAAQVASVIHRGPMDGVDDSYQLLHAWARDNGYTAAGSAREIYLEVHEDTTDWVTEIQLDITR
jgi:DNA-binding transcriptional MerR regulator/effector-binding domain-containing protein